MKSEFTEFDPVSDEELLNIIKSMPDKSCANDPIPTWLNKKCLPQLLNITSIINNMSLSDSFPTALKEAVICPGLKK